LLSFVNVISLNLFQSGCILKSLLLRCFQLFLIKFDNKRINYLESSDIQSKLFLVSKSLTSFKDFIKTKSNICKKSIFDLSKHCEYICLLLNDYFTQIEKKIPALKRSEKEKQKSGHQSNDELQ
jgi:hypothetical protein